MIKKFSQIAFGVVFIVAASSLIAQPKSIPKEQMDRILGGLFSHLAILRGLRMDSKCASIARQDETALVSELINGLARSDGRKQATEKEITDFRAMVNQGLSQRLPDGRSVGEQTYDMMRNAAIESGKLEKGKSYCETLINMAANARHLAVSSLPPQASGK